VRHHRGNIEATTPVPTMRLLVSLAFAGLAVIAAAQGPSSASGVSSNSMSSGKSSAASSSSDDSCLDACKLSFLASPTCAPVHTNRRTGEDDDYRCRAACGAAAGPSPIHLRCAESVCVPNNNTVAGFTAYDKCIYDCVNSHYIADIGSPTLAPGGSRSGNSSMRLPFSLYSYA
jgi:hypothetical protein